MTAFTLKIIALSAMLIDHTGAAFPEVFPFWFRCIGRLAWPIYAYLLAEGFQHTKAPEKFLMRLLAFAAISEIPFDLVTGHAISFAGDTNIFYTLFLGGMAIRLYERIKERRGPVGRSISDSPIQLEHSDGQTVAVIAAILPTAILAEILGVDYGGMGVLFIFAMYAVKPRVARLIAFGGFALSQFIPVVAALAAAPMLGVDVSYKYLLMIPFAAATVPLIALYNGERGVRAKWLFYWVYPAHLTVLAVVSLIINGING